MNLEQLEGKWYIQYTNFPMWLKGDKKDPYFNYSVGIKNGKPGLKDKVGFYKNGKYKSIKGFDYPLNSENTYFKWKGSGWLFFVKSLWRIEHFAKSSKWMLISFEKTLFTPAGYDIISRKQTIEAATRAEIIRVMDEKFTNIDLLKI